MRDDPENLTLIYLRRLDLKIDGLVEDNKEIKLRLTNVEQQVASLAATVAGHYVSTSMRLDRLEARVERIEHRLELSTH